MLNSKRIVRIAMKWPKIASFGGRRASSSPPTVVSRGHVFVHSIDGQRFMIPLAYLSSSVFRELLRISEDEFGLQPDGPIMMPCNALAMECILSLLRCRVPFDDGKDLLHSILGRNCNASPSSSPWVLPAANSMG